MRTLVLSCLVWVCALALPGFARGQTSATPPPPQAPTAGSPAAKLQVFLDCQGRCDSEYVKQHVEFVDYVRDRTVADVHVLVTSQETGGGTEWTLAFLGLGRFQSRDSKVSFSLPRTTTEEKTLEEFNRLFKLGIASYAANTIVSPELNITWTPTAESLAVAAKTVATRDPWHYWVFDVGISGHMNGEERSKSREWSAEFNANRTTAQWKIRLSYEKNEDSNHFALDDETVFSTLTRSSSFRGFVAKSLGPKWSIGSTASFSHSSFSNLHRSITAMPGIEYDFFPYSQSSRRSLTLRYTVGVLSNEYAEITIFDKLRETLPQHQLQVSLDLREPWGSINMRSTWSQQLNNLRRNRGSVFGSANIRLFGGFEFNVFAEYSRIRDLISLKKETASEEEVLLRLQQLATGYSYSVHLGFSYSFGSIFNSVVNPRFGG